MEQISMFDDVLEEFKITKPIKLIEFFAGYGSQALALKYLNLDFTHHRICEWAIKSIQAYKDIHFKDDNTDYSQLFSKEQIIDYLYKKGISSNYNNSMSYEQIKRLGEQQLRTIYNNIIATKNLVNITQVHGKDLDITDTESFTYLLTYSFPCQDLSLAGKGKGMKRDGGTRSGMLWEVERILKELNQLGTLPKILLMENVPQVIGKKHIRDFQDWELFLRSLGYENNVEILNSKDYGVPQNRKRAFMISILGNYKYKFPKPFELKLRLKDVLEDNVDESYFLSDKMLRYLNKKINQGWKKKLITSKEEISTCVCNSSRNQINDTYIIDCVRQNGVNDIEVKLVGGIGEMKSNGGTQFYQQDRIYDSESIAMCHPANLPSGSYMHLLSDLRIRKLTPKECGRLMGVRDEDIDKLTLSKSAQYHCFGDSIVVDVLMEIFKQML